MKNADTTKTTPKPRGKRDWSRLDAMTEEERHAAAMSDPDAQPLSPEDLARMKPVPRTKTMRRAFGLTQEQFAACFRIPIGTIRDWEQGISEPDAAARAYLTVIAADPVAVCKAFVAAPSPEEKRPINYRNLGVIYQARGDLAQAEAQFRKALELSKALGHKEGIAQAHASLASLYEKRGDKAKACKHWRKARDVFAEVHMPEMVEQAERSLQKAGGALG